MAKSDKRATLQGIKTGQQTSDIGYGAGISGATSRLYGEMDPTTGQRSGGLISNLGRERQNLLSGYGNLAETGGIGEGEYNRLLTGDYGRSIPNYLDVYSDLTGSSGGFGGDRLGRVSSASRSLLSGGNYKDVNQGISSLLNARNNLSNVEGDIGALRSFASSGGVSPDAISRINRPIFEEYERTGGYNPEDISNIRSRANQGTTSVYSNLRDALERNRLASGQAGPGFGSSQLKLARQSAQAAGDTARDTELGISNAIREGRLSAADRIAANQLALSGLQSRNTLEGYGQAASLGINKEQAINEAMARAASLGLSREQQIQEGQRAAANIDLQTQGLISQNRLAGARGLQDERQRQAELDAANQRFLIGQRTGTQLGALGGLQNLYGQMPGQEAFYQNLLRDYLGGQTGANLAWNQQRAGASQIPGLGSTIGNIAGFGAGLIPGLGSLFGREQRNPASYLGVSPQLMGAGYFGGY